MWETANDMTTLVQNEVEDRAQNFEYVRLQSSIVVV